MEQHAILPTSHPHHKQLRFPGTLLETIRTASAHIIRLSIAAVMVTWVPSLAFAAMAGTFWLKGFLLDFAAQSRLLIVIPLLIVTEPTLRKRLANIAHHFVAADLVHEEDVGRFEAAFAKFERRNRAPLLSVVIVGLVYISIVSALPQVRVGILPPWCYAAGSSGDISLAAWWYLLVGLPVMNYLVLRWIWRQVLWTWFLRSVVQMDLRVIPAHPDLMGGLGFVENCIEGYIPFGFAVGTIAAGLAANGVFHFHRSLSSFRYLPLGVAAFILILSVGPLCSFFSLLLRTKRRGVFEYGALAIRLGHEFEKKWLPSHHDVSSSMLDAPDFSATIDLYSVVGNVRQLSLLPVGLQTVLRLVVVSLLPAIPVAVAAVPFDVLFTGAMKFLL